MADTVLVTLAHHLRREGTDLLPGAEIEVPQREARELIASGYVAGVDPGDAAAVAQALAPSSVPARPLGVPAKTPAEGPQGA